MSGHDNLYLGSIGLLGEYCPTSKRKLRRPLGRVGCMHLEPFEDFALLQGCNRVQPTFAAIESTAAFAHRPVMRIYVGGVSPAVTTADIEKTFSSLGRVTGVELVRTNGRNFAYMNFEPASDKTLAKLFSTYNGCTWKGGKLKLERAKEHYLDRLKREWAEDAELVSQTPIVPDIEKDAGNSKIERLNLESMQLRIFFPKLRKVKSLPFKGTGKHKYSFQRIEVPPLPIHFCDCEEHRESSETASNKYFSSLKSGIHYEKELNIMNSVMNKLFEKESNEPTMGKETMLATAENVSHLSNSDIHVEESDEESEMDADNLVTNIRIRRRDPRIMHLGRKTLAVNQGSRVGKHQTSKNELDKNRANAKKRQKTALADASEVKANKKAHLELPDEVIENEFSAILPQKKTSEVHFQEPEVSSEPPLDKDQIEPSMISTQSTKGKSWLQKSSWKELVGGTAKSSFSISHSQEPDISAEPPLYKGQTKPSMIATQSTKGKRQSFKNELDQNKANAKQRQQAGLANASEVTENKKAHSELPVEIIENEFSAILPRNTTSKGHSQEQVISAEPSLDKGQTEPSMIATQSTKGQSWLQKSSWKDLVGGTSGISSFSITNVLPGITSLIPKQPKASDSAIDTTTEAKEIKAQPDSKISKTLEKAPADEMLGKEDQIQAHAGGDEQKAVQKSGEQKSGRTMPEVGVSEVCTFMRSAESLKQWSQARVALSRQLSNKRKNDEEDSPKSMKGARPRKR